MSPPGIAELNHPKSPCSTPCQAQGRLQAGMGSSLALSTKNSRLRLRIGISGVILGFLRMSRQAAQFLSVFGHWCLCSLEMCHWQIPIPSCWGHLGKGLRLTLSILPRDRAEILLSHPVALLSALPAPVPAALPLISRAKHA